MRRAKTVFSLTAILIFIFSSLGLPTENFSVGAQENFSLKRIGPVAYVHYPQPLDWIITSENRSIVFARDYDEDEKDSYLWSLVVDANGDLVHASRLLDLYNSWINAGRAVWIVNGEEPENSYGYLFVARHSMQENRKSSDLRFVAVRFDSDGLIEEESDLLFEKELPENIYFTNVWLEATLREGSIGVVMAYSIYEYTDSFIGNHGSDARFLEFHPDGYILPAGIQKIKQVRNGEFKIFHPYKPVWNGVSWMAPVAETTLQPMAGYSGQTSRKWTHRIKTLVATPTSQGQNLKVKTRKLEKIIEWDYIPYTNLVFFPPAPQEPGTEGHTGENVVQTLQLLYTTASPIRNMTEKKQVATNYAYFLRAANRKGKNARPRHELLVPEWQRLIPPRENWYVPQDYNFFSEPLPLDPEMYFIVQARGAYFLWSKDASVSKEEMQLNLYVFNPREGTGEVIHQKNQKGEVPISPPILRYFNDGPCMITTLLTLQAQYSYIDLYFTRF